jgi:hypothetical protein
MATARIYRHPEGDLLHIGQGSSHIAATEIGLTLLFTDEAYTLSVALQTSDLRALILDLADAIAKHQNILNGLKAGRA